MAIVDPMTWTPDPQALRGRVAVVAGATRGAGRGIATALGETGATVICTGRSTRAPGPRRSDYDRPETIEETAELVTRLGGTGIARVVDHLDSAEVKRLADDIHRTHGHIDILVNDIWGAEVLKGGPSEWNTPLWNHDLQKGLRILRLGVETHLITSHHLLPLVIARPGGLLVEVTDGTFEYNSTHYRLSTFYDLAKTPSIAWSLTGTRARGARCHGGVDQPRVAAFRDDARDLRRVRGKLASTAHSSTPTPWSSGCRRTALPAGAPMDPRVGGTYKMSFTNFTSGKSHSFGGEYLELVPHERLRWTDRLDDPNLPGEMTVTVRLKKVSVGTEVNIVQEPRRSSWIV